MMVDENTSGPPFDMSHYDSVQDCILAEKKWWRDRAALYQRQNAEKDREIQGLRGLNARREIELSIIEDLLKGQSEFFHPITEYWREIHDRIQALVKRAAHDSAGARNE